MRWYWFVHRYIPTEQLRYQYPQPEGFYHARDSLAALNDEKAAIARELLLRSVQLELSRLVLGSSADMPQSKHSADTVDCSAQENTRLLDDLYTLVRASRTPAVAEMLLETITFVRRAGVVAETVGKLEEMRESLLALTVLAADTEDHGQWLQGASTMKQVSRDLER